MTHPQELLAGYVDDSLTTDERAVVDAHLATCEICREEVDLAGRAVRALDTLEEERVPVGVTPPVIGAARKAAPRSRGFFERYQWAAGLAAAACLVLVAAVLGPRLLGGSAEDGSGPADRAPTAELEGADDTTLGAGAAAVQVEVLDENLDEGDLRRLAREAAKAAPGVPDSGETAVALAPADEAIPCLTASGATFDDRDVLVRVLQADYLGTPAFIAVFHEGPGGGLPAERVVVWAVSSADCTNLTFLSQNI